MNIADPKYLQHLRELPTSYLIDILVDNDDVDNDAIMWVLQERRLDRSRIRKTVQSRRDNSWKRPYFLWAIARWLTLLITLLATSFNFVGLYKLMNSDHIFKGPLLFLVAGSIIFGFIVGYKLTTHTYHGSKSLISCGFPFPVGHVELRTGSEMASQPALMYAGMAVNALVGISLTLFPLILICFTLE